jgi:membrane-bound inhibitor of C-type lysozyme
MGDQWVDLPLPQTSRNDGDYATSLTNLMAVPSPPGADVKYVLRSAPGIKSKVLSGSGAMRGAIAHGDYVWWVRGTELRRYDGTTTTLVGTVAGTALVHMVGVATNEIAIVDGAGNEYRATTGVVSAITPPAGNFSDITHQDGRTIAIRDGTDEFYISDQDDPVTWGALNFSTADALADRLIACYVHNRELFLLGEKHIEVWVNTGASPFPFERAVPGVIDKGCRAAGSVAHYGNSLFFLGRDFRVYRLDGYVPVPVSDDLVETQLRTFFTTAGAVRASTYIDRGVPCYSISPSTAGAAGFAWVYNIRDGAWHLEGHLDGGSAVIDLVDVVEFKTDTSRLNIAAVSSTSSANGFDHGIYTHASANMQDEASSAVSIARNFQLGPFALAGGKRVFEHELELTTGYDALATQSVSLDTDNESGTAILTAAARTGTGILRWHRNGVARSRFYDFTITSTRSVIVHRLRARIEVGL